jgi:hypothetical protein
MKSKLIIPIVIMLVLILSQTGLASVLDSDQVKIIIHISEQIEVEFDDKSLDLNLENGVSSEMKFKINTNSPLTVSFESIEGFGENINDLFEYVVVYELDGEERKVTFKPGGYLPTGIIEMDPGEKEWKLIIRLKQDTAEQWQILLDEGLENIETIELDIEWTDLEPGLYTDFVNITFHKLQIDQYIMENTK